ncbi:hypothetical protein [Massilia sp. YIM B04103]|uniref:hypothetical protein n=1 Tax=Massilia sp. YIM B04103 TaxID=2963106 RepID=UPI00210B070E|nr:hypothetical protein [Massilia sp. YIM B04103]
MMQLSSRIVGLKRLLDAIEQSHRRLELPKNASTETYRIFNGLRLQMEKLHPAQIELIEFALHKLPAVIKVHDSNMRMVRAASGEIDKEDEGAA